jgi:predicted Zn-dependent protease
MLFYPIQEEGAGWAIAGSLASRGLSTNAPLIEYVNFIGNMVAEASHGYDLGFRFFVLNDDSRESYATPGGFVFITTGLLKQIESEAELAGILAHEIAHVTLRHGLEELANTRNVVAADAAFSELDGSVERTDEERKLTDSINDELITYRDRMYSMRNQDFEKEADAMALAYMARAGYTPQGLLNVVTRLLNNIPAGSPPYQANELSNRFNALQAEMASPRWRDNLMTNAERYLEMRNRIR